MANYTFSDKIKTLKPSAIREILKRSSDPSIVPFSAGNPAPEAFPVKAVERITAEIMKNEPILALQYSVTEGYESLKAELRSLAKGHYNAMSDEDDLIIVSGAQQGIELSCKVLCNEGDTVICENPSFIGSLNSFRSYNVNLVGVPMEEDGISIDKLEHSIKSNKNVRFLYVIPNFQNPSGITMSIEKRRAVYELARKYDIIIVEDNPYGDLRFEGEHLPPIKSLDADGRVIYCGSFSKILSPGLRVGYTVARPEIIAKITVAKQCSDVHTTILSQLICYHFLKEENLENHLNTLRDIYKKKCALMCKEIEESFSERVTYIRPQGGLFLWCTLPQGADMLKFCSDAVEKFSVAVVPGSAFLADTNAVSQSFRLNYSTPTDENIIKGVKLLGELTKQL